MSIFLLELYTNFVKANLDASDAWHCLRPMLSDQPESISAQAGITKGSNTDGLQTQIIVRAIMGVSWIIPASHMQKSGCPTASLGSNHACTMYLAANCSHTTCPLTALLTYAFTWHNMDLQLSCTSRLLIGRSSMAACIRHLQHCCSLTNNFAIWGCVPCHDTCYGRPDKTPSVHLPLAINHISQQG